MRNTNSGDVMVNAGTEAAIAGYLVMLLCVAAPTVHAQPSGQASVTDGDSLEIAGQSIRLHRIDAPEWKQRWRPNGRRWRCG